MSTNLVKMILKKITFFFSHGSVLLKFLISHVRSLQFLIQITKFGLKIFNIGEHIFFSFILFAKFWMIVCDFFYLDLPLLILNSQNVTNMRWNPLLDYFWAVDRKLHQSRVRKHKIWFHLDLRVDVNFSISFELCPRKLIVIGWQVQVHF